jgi:hypothetical protein
VRYPRNSLVLAMSHFLLPNLEELWRLTTTSALATAILKCRFSCLLATFGHRKLDTIEDRVENRSFHLLYASGSAFLFDAGGLLSVVRVRFFF